MTTSRREFLKGLGGAYFAATSGAHPSEVGEFPDPELQPFVQIGGTRIRGARDLLANGWQFTVTSEEFVGGRRYRLAIRNAAGRGRTVDVAGVVLPPIRPARKRQWRLFLDSGHSGWCGVKRLEALGPDQYLQPIKERQPDGRTVTFHESDMEVALWDARTGESALVGFLRQRHGRNMVRVIPNAEATDISSIEAVQQMGFEIRPGGEQPMDPLIFSVGRDPFAMLETYGDAVAKYHGRRFDGHPIVGMMTWYGYRTAIDETIVLDNAELIADLFSDYPQEMQIMMLCDHGWEENANWGYWEPDKKRFHHGMKWLAEQLQKRGMSLGLWYTPFCATQSAENYRHLLALASLDSQGKPRTTKVCAWGQLPGQPNCMPVIFLDGGKPSVQKIWHDTLVRMKEWGTVYWKLDFFNLQTSASNRRKLGDGNLYAETYRTFRSAVGTRLLNPCSCDTNLQVGYCDSARVAADVGNSGNWTESMDSYRHAMGTIAALWFKHRKFWVNDPDSIQFAKGCSLPEARVRATMVAMSGGHVMVSEDLRRVDAERLEIVRRLLPAYPHAARPLDLFQNPFPEGYPAIWSLPVRTGFGFRTVLAVFNLTSEPRVYEVTPSMLGIEKGAEFLALEWWQYRWLGRFREKFKVGVPAGDVAIIHAQLVRDVPCGLSVSHHFTGGYIVEEAAFDSSTGELRGVLATKPGLRLVLFGTQAQGWRFATRETFHGIENSLGGWQSEIVTTSKRTPFTIQFQKT